MTRIVLLTMFLIAGCAAEQCCYTSAKDCDSPKDWCSTSAAHCSNCNGKWTSPGADATSPAAKLSEKGGMTPWKAWREGRNKVPKIVKAPGQTPAASQAPADQSGFGWPFAETLIAGSAAERCCYSSAKDCDRPDDWCSKSAAHCSNCNGKLTSPAAADAPKAAAKLSEKGGMTPWAVSNKVPKIVKAPGQTPAASQAPADQSGWGLPFAETLNARYSMLHTSLESAPAVTFMAIAAFFISLASAVLRWHGSQQYNSGDMSQPMLGVAVV